MLSEILCPKLTQFQNLVSLRKITTTRKCDYKPSNDPPVAKEKLKHRFVPCCEMTMTKIEGAGIKVNPEWPQPRVVIIGAGMAGLTAASTLHSAGITNFIVLEAKERPGGRIHSCKFGETTVEYGASYINGGCVANPIFNLASMGRCLGYQPERYSIYPEQYLTTDGRSIIPQENMYKFYDQLLQQASGFFTKKITTYKHLTLHDFLNEKLTQKINKLPPEKRNDFILVSNGVLNDLRSKWGEDLSAISLEQFGSQINIPGGYVNLPKGCLSMVQPLILELPKDAVLYNKPVQCIRWGTSMYAQPRALVIGCDGSEFEADYVICTFSLGVIQNQANLLFLPSLPDYKLLAAQHLGFGIINKIFLEYARPFWLKSMGTKLKIAWTNEQLSVRDNWVKGISTIEEIKGRGNVLMCTVCGREAWWTEKLTEIQLAQETTAFLRQITGDPTIPCPININRSKWGADVYANGSKAYMKLGSSIKDVCNLGKPVPCLHKPPVLLFAGEATYPGHTSNMTGARLSGIREGYRVLGLTQLFEGPPKVAETKEFKMPPCLDPDHYSKLDEVNEKMETAKI